MLCREMRVSLNEHLGWCDLSGKVLPITGRQQSVWNVFLFEDLNRPSRTDHYLMQIAAILCADPKIGKVPDLDSMRLKWKTEEVTQPTSNRKVKNAQPHIPGLPRPIQDQADLDRIGAKMFFASAQAMTSNPMGGPKGGDWDAKPHPAAVVGRQVMIDNQAKESN